MTSIGDIYDYIDSIAPFEGQISYDNSGLTVGSRERAVNRAYVCLDVTGKSVQRAAQTGCELMICHHPPIFSPIKSISANAPVYKLLSAGIDVISAHTSYDVAENGVNFCLGRILGLQSLRREERADIGVTGELAEATDAEGLAAMVKEKLGCGGVSFLDGGRNIKTVAIVGGAGGDEIAQFFGLADAFVTGEAKHHQLLEAADRGMTVVVAGHFETEACAMPPLAKRLAERFPEVEFISGEDKPHMRYI